MNSIISKGIAQFSISFRNEAFYKRVFNSNFRLFTYPVAKSNCNSVSFCSSSESNDTLFRSVPIEELRTKYKKPVDWLPFEWRRRKRFDAFEKSGDLVKTFEYDPSWPKPDFELSDELKTASDDVKHMFTLATGSKSEIKEVVKRNILKKVQRHPNDLDSLEVQIALQTIRVRSLFEHSITNRKDKISRRARLHAYINKRNEKLKDLYRIDRERFNWLTQELKLEYTPQRLGGTREKYNKKWDIRRLTRLYSEMLVKNQKNAYHEELKQQQADFLKEKEEILAWIEKEEKELENLTI